MNCKPGDLAMVINSTAGNDGKIVSVIAPLGRHLTRGPNGIIGTLFWWKISPPLEDWSGTVGDDIADFQLRPIRDQPGTDEIIRIAGKPNKEKVGG